MRIISTLLPPEVTHLSGVNRPTVVMAFDTLVQGKSLVVGITEGIVAGPDAAIRCPAAMPKSPRVTHMLAAARPV